MANATASMAAMATATSKATFGAEVVTQTLDKLNKYGSSKKSSGFGSMSDTYNFSKDILSAVYSGKGAIANIIG